MKLDREKLKEGIYLCEGFVNQYLPDNTLHELMGSNGDWSGFQFEVDVREDFCGPEELLLPKEYMT